jgi:hypothetical protein
VIFSLLVPGFGIARGGHLGRAAAWFLGLQAGTVVVALGIALEQIPFGVAVGAAVCWFIAFLVMIYQSYSPGGMSGKHWAAFVGLLALTVVVRPPAYFVVHPAPMIR